VKLERHIIMPADASQMRRKMTDALNDITKQVNGVSEGTLAAFHTARVSAPTTGTWAKGDEIKNSDPSELGSASSKYVITGWICTVGGTPGTWLEMRTLTGG
jgi:hypothetical protein